MKPKILSKDKLPKKDGRYDVELDNGKMHILYFDVESGHWMNDKNQVGTNGIVYMPERQYILTWRSIEK